MGRLRLGFGGVLTVVGPRAGIAPAGDSSVKRVAPVRVAVLRTLLKPACANIGRADDYGRS